jgi:hypothetical protein
VVIAAVDAAVDATSLASPQPMIVEANNTLPIHRVARAVAEMSIAVFYRDSRTPCYRLGRDGRA